jgi:hypothetical protein
MGDFGFAWENGGATAESLTGLAALSLRSVARQRIDKKLLTKYEKFVCGPVSDH